ncbi:hypothetical protein D3C85_1722660 [compost metagenome]
MTCLRHLEVAGLGDVAADLQFPALQVNILPCQGAELPSAHACPAGELDPHCVHVVPGRLLQATKLILIKWVWFIPDHFHLGQH